MTMKTAQPTGDVPAPTRRMILQSITHADVIYVAFPRLQSALIVDFRQQETDFPATVLTTLAYTPQLQAETVQRLRPGLPAARAFASVTWGGSTRAFAEQGVLPAILNRLPPAHAEAVTTAFDQLQEAERAAAPRASKVAR